MKTKDIFNKLIVCTNSIFLSSFAFSDVISKDFSKDKSKEETRLEVRQNWDEESFINSKPQSLPIVDITVKEMKERGVTATTQSIDEFETKWKSSKIEMGPDEIIVEKSKLPDFGGLVPAAAGSKGAYFSSSRLTPMDARLHYPYSASGKIFFKDDNDDGYICSGSVIASRLVATAGHCVHKGNDGENGFYKDIVFIPAWHEGSSPFGVWSATWVATTPAWTTGNGDVPNEADFAVLEVADQEINGEVVKLGDLVGIYAFKTNALMKNHLKIIGYPGSFDNGNIMHQVDTGDGAAAQNNTVLYGSDMTGGSSGGGWIQNFGEKADGQPDAVDDEFNTLVGITSYGFVSSEPKVQGSSILNNDFVDLYNAGCDRDPDNCEN